jgi:hypothetical protein
LTQVGGKVGFFFALSPFYFEVYIFYFEVLVKVVKVFSPTFGFGGLMGSLRESRRKSLHNLHNPKSTFSISDL